MQFTVQLALDDDDKLVGYIYMQGVCARIERRSSKKGARPNARCSATTIDDGGDGAAAARKVHCGVTLMGLQAAAALVGRYIDRTTTC
jgi:hypothetical protein